MTEKIIQSEILEGLNDTSISKAMLEELLNRQPDWTSPEEYPNADEMTAPMWAWEFIRRNKFYQKYYYFFCRIKSVLTALQEQGELLPLTYQNLRSVFGLPEDTVKRDGQELLEQMELDDFAQLFAHRTLMEEEGFDVRASLDALAFLGIPQPPHINAHKLFSQLNAKRKCVTFFVPKRLPDEGDQRFQIRQIDNHPYLNSDTDQKDQYEKILRAHAEQESDICVQSPGYLGHEPYTAYSSVVFLHAVLDVRGDINGQVKDIKKVAKEQRKFLKEQTNLLSDQDRVKRNRIGDYTMYLRIFDADSQGERARDIAAILFPKLRNVDPDYAASQQVRNYLTRAKKLVDTFGEELTRMK